MSVGTGLYMLGAYLVLVAAYMSSTITEKGLKQSRTGVVIATAIALIVTFFDKGWDKWL